MPPDSGTPRADLGAQLDAVLLHALWWLLLAGVAAALITWWASRRHASGYERVRLALFGSRTVDANAEPRARRFLRLSFGVLWIVDGLLQAQPAMPGTFGADMLSPGAAASPRWLGDVISPMAGIWTRHPILADAATVWVQIGLGLLFLIGGRGLLIKCALWASIIWGLLVWVVGEFLGGLVWPGASWLVGAPGAVVVYIVGAAALIAPWRWWEAGSAALFARRVVGAWMLLCAALQAVPWEGLWSADRLSAPFTDGAQTAQPWLFSRPISALANATNAEPKLVNAILIAVLVVVGLGLCLTRTTAFVVVGIVVCAATWWLAQDFGVLGGTATDPNAALPLALLLACALPQWQVAASGQNADRTALNPPRLAALRMPTAVGLSAIATGALLVTPIVMSGVLLSPADSAAVAADSDGGVVSIPGRAAPAFDLTDQNGQPVSLARLHGKLTLITFFDPVCSDDCPLIANQLAIADRQLGELANHVEIIAIDSNPVFHNVADVAAFTTSHGLADLPNWHFLAGPTNELQDAIAAYGIVVQVPTVGMIEHGEGIFFIDAEGNQQAYLSDGANEDLTQSYASTVKAEIRRLLA
ncbi:MAG: SCO family protein [Acidothermaceae bacterium]